MTKFRFLLTHSILATLTIAVLAQNVDAAGNRREKKPRSASEKANEAADEQMYQPIEYVNKATPGPQLVVLPGEIKSSSVGIDLKLTPNSIADFAELELSQANFTVLERSDLGPLLDELALAVNLGDPEAMKQFKRGKFESTRWFVKFDVLKAEHVATNRKGFNGGPLGAIVGSLGGDAASAGGHALGSVQSQQEAGVWIVGLRYKVLDATTTEQVTTGYKEMKMELGGKAKAFLGFESSSTTTIGLDTISQRLVQECVAELDAKNK